MLIGTWLKQSIAILEAASVPTAQLDAEVMLAELLKRDRSWIHAHSEDLIPDDNLSILNEWISRRATHEPLAYIRGKQEFYSRDFFVSPDTLTPRPETETLVEHAIKIIQTENITSIADIGTGSGCIIISLALELGASKKFSGYDISAEAITIAQKNAAKHKVDISFEIDDICSQSAHAWQNAELTVANLPYVPDDFHINLAASHEPKFAIFGGADGLDLYRTLFSKLTVETRFVVTESLPMQHELLESIAAESDYKQIKESDFIQLFQRG